MQFPKSAPESVLEHYSKLKIGLPKRANPATHNHFSINESGTMPTVPHLHGPFASVVIGTPITAVREALDEAITSNISSPQLGSPVSALSALFMESSNLPSPVDNAEQLDQNASVSHRSPDAPHELEPEASIHQPSPDDPQELEPIANIPDHTPDTPQQLEPHASVFSSSYYSSHLWESNASSVLDLSPDTPLQVMTSFTAPTKVVIGFTVPPVEPPKNKYYIPRYEVAFVLSRVFEFMDKSRSEIDFYRIVDKWCESEDLNGNDYANFRQAVDCIDHPWCKTLPRTRLVRRQND